MDRTRPWLAALLACALAALGAGCDDDDDDRGAGGSGLGGAAGGGGAGALERRAALTGAHEVPPVATGASGEVEAVRKGDALTVTGSFSGLSSPLLVVGGSPAHVHLAGPGANGPVVFPLEVESGDGRGGTFEGTFRLDESQRAAFDGGEYYVNVHTERYPSGELRAQLADAQARDPDVLFEIELSGAEVEPAVATGATGHASVSLTGPVLAISGAFFGLSSPALAENEPPGPAHVHRGLPTQNGDVVFPLELEPAADRLSATFTGTRTLETEERELFDEGALYLDVHGGDHPGGELRGQLAEPALR